MWSSDTNGSLWPRTKSLPPTMIFFCVKRGGPCKISRSVWKKQSIKHMCHWHPGWEVDPTYMKHMGLLAYIKNLFNFKLPQSTYVMKKTCSMPFTLSTTSQKIVVFKFYIRLCLCLKTNQRDSDMKTFTAGALELRQKLCKWRFLFLSRSVDEARSKNTKKPIGEWM